MIIRHFNTLDMVESVDLMCVHNTVESRNYFYRCADWFIGEDRLV